jgi:uncharacterized protein (DUF1778 family)
MNQTYTHALTLRLSTETDELITEAAFDRRMTKSDWIRASIRQSLKAHHAKSATGDSK